MTKYTNTLLNIILPILLFSISISCSPKPEDIVMAYMTAYNRHDIQKIVSLFSEEAVFEVSSHFELRGKDAIRNVAEYDSVLNIHMSLSNFKIEEDTVRCDLVETNDWLKVAGIGEARYETTFILNNGLITQILARTSQKSEQEFNRVVPALLQWAAMERARQLAEMTPGGVFKYNAENARKSLALLKAWRELNPSQ